MASNDQSNLSERSQPLYELNSDLDMPYQGSGVHNNKRSRQFKSVRQANRDIRFLDTFAVALTTGKPVDVFAAAMDKRQHIQLVLAKNANNGPPTSEDVVSLIGRCPKVPLSKMRWTSFPFCFDDFRLALQTYVHNSDIQAEFPGAGAILEKTYGDAVPPFAMVWGDLVEKITNKTVH